MSVVLVIGTILLASACLIMPHLPYTNTYADADNSMVEIDAKKPFAGADGNIKLMGVVHNTGDIPLEVMDKDVIAIVKSPAHYLNTILLIMLMAVAGL